MSTDDSMNFQRAYLNFFKFNLIHDCKSECPLECNSIDYNLLISHSTFQSKINSDDPFSNNTKKFNSSNNLKLNIYYDSLSFTTNDEVAKMDLIDLISNIGGTLGLFTGVSFLSNGEIFELGLFLLTNIFKARQKRLNPIDR